jgi:hypothetical protein
VSRAAVRSRGMQGQGGQATVEWVALVLLAALVLTAGAALSRREADRDLGELVAKRIARGPSGLARAATPRAPATPWPGVSAPPAPSASAPRSPGASPPRSPSVSAPRSPGASAPRPAPPMPAPRAPRTSLHAFRRLRGAADVGRHAWIACLGYRRWRFELNNPLAPSEALPVGEALSILNDCFNPHDYLVED